MSAVNAMLSCRRATRSSWALLASTALALSACGSEEGSVVERDPAATAAAVQTPEGAALPPSDVKPDAETPVVAGEYLCDKDNLIAAMKARSERPIPEAWDIKVRFADDHTFRLAVTFGSEVTAESKGTWVQDGRRLTIKTTFDSTRGGDIAPRVETAEYRDGVIHWTASERGSYDIVLKRQG